MKAPTTPTPKPDPYAAWRSREYRLFTLSWALLFTCKQAETVALGWIVLQQTRDPLALGMLGLVQALPVILLALVGGQLADRFDRKLVLLLTLGLGLLSSAGLAAVVMLDLNIRWVYPLLLLAALGMALGGPSRAAMLPQLVPPAVFANAMAWNSSAFQMATMIGPAVGGLLLAQGAKTVFLITLGGRALSLLMVGLIRPRPQIRAAEPVTLRTLAAGVDFVWRTREILASITLDMFAVLLGGFTYLLPIFANDILPMDDAFRPTFLGLLRSAEAAGALCMAVALAHLPPVRRAGRTLLWVVGAFGAGIVAFALSRNPWLSLAIMAALGALDNVSVVIRHTLVQMLTPDRMRGRVSAVNGVFIAASNDIGGLESGVTARLFGDLAAALGWAEGDKARRVVGSVISVAVGGVGTMCVVAGAAAVFPQLRRLGSLADLRPIEAQAVRERAEGEIAQRD